MLIRVNENAYISAKEMRVRTSNFLKLNMVQNKTVQVINTDPHRVIS